MHFLHLPAECINYLILFSFYLFDQPTLNARKARWLDFLCEFDFEINHIKGKENNVVDVLSRKEQEMHVASVSVFQLELR